ncbi:hypothetical protein C8R45DRAFT_1071305 [Mycena sanguinolenta]|nr:hypothetical protein C8R45DRAFT_1071305 [Mycena sanguinolenta]
MTCSSSLFATATATPLASTLLAAHAPPRPWDHTTTSLPFARRPSHPTPLAIPTAPKVARSVPAGWPAALRLLTITAGVRLHSPRPPLREMMSVTPRTGVIVGGEGGRGHGGGAGCHQEVEGGGKTPHCDSDVIERDQLCRRRSIYDAADSISQTLSKFVKDFGSVVNVFRLAVKPVKLRGVNFPISQLMENLTPAAGHDVSHTTTPAVQAVRAYGAQSALQYQLY